jgi:hypothetical protein
MDVDQSSPRSDLLPHHSDEGEWEFPIEDVQSSVEGVCAAFPNRKVSATTTMSTAAEYLFHQGIDRVIAHTPPNRFPQLESPKRPESLSYSAPDISTFRRLRLSAGFAKGFASNQAATLNKGTAAEKGSRECEKSFLTSLARSSPGLDVYVQKYSPLTSVFFLTLCLSTEKYT